MQSRPDKAPPFSAALVDSGELLQGFKRLNAIGVALSSERSLPHLLEQILSAAQDLTHADGGTLYRLDDTGQHLYFAILRNRSLALAYGGASGKPLSDAYPSLSLSLNDGTPNRSLVATCAAHTGQTINIADAYACPGFDFSGTCRFDELHGYRSRSFLTVPMHDHEGQLVGVLQLINATHPGTGAVEAFSAVDQRLAESLASQAAVALTNRLLIEQTEQLFESFIGLMNAAIDEKSPHTGGHCQRVPELAMMLAQAVNASQEGPLAHLQFDAATLQELRIAALLHDCGKVTTPVHVVDKATKLQTLHDRIHEIEARFEAVRQEAQAQCWRAIADGAAREPTLEAWAQWDAQCLEDRAALRAANVGSERMSEALLAHVQLVAQRYTWRNPAGERVALLSADELENLSIRSGTLNAAERKLINQHIDTTIRMLEQLPWPRHLQRVTEFAGGHHERMDGKGYPKGLHREQMSWPARLLGIADVFEALTASDRPYKRALTIEEALRIMDKFAANGHIDPDLYQVFLSQGVPQRYARRFGIAHGNPSDGPLVPEAAPAP